ncbi:ribosome maturation factor RimP [Candidatus Kinetoplastidibacterium galati]|uniref:Ribosome maturation factor RimP n=1 Tax=Candidatus Kinetoplastidibacterium galati TCC219 TaxID=1208921 RepID=M1MB65_9PROT|nr:ribosome maturation factor RimP [Candidatus Kinetoplastibacterium galatii]AGF49115.1 putative ribosome maturation protein RimP [Candidatus Kinetoplastibacterium galatii TCC219]
MVDLFALIKNSLLGIANDIEIVDIERLPSGVLRVIIDKTGGVCIDDCEIVTRHLSCVLAAENIDYRQLEISSPGIDRPLRRESDFIRFAGERIVLKLNNPLDGQKVFHGILRMQNSLSLTDDSVIHPSNTVFSIESDDNEKKNNLKVINFNINDVCYAKLDPVLDFKGRKQ